ncbi:hypothetical protein LINPERPRIM_LOCUS18665 [Linum perenne]
MKPMDPPMKPMDPLTKPTEPPTKPTEPPTKTHIIRLRVRSSPTKPVHVLNINGMVSDDDMQLDPSSILKTIVDLKTGNWWLYFQGKEVGYWPGGLFTNLEISVTIRVGRRDHQQSDKRIPH